VRNSELQEMLSSMRDLERTFNHKFNYPWLFLNDQPFTQEFMDAVQKETKADVRFGTTFPSRSTY
jgi:mannosyltransferase